MKTGTHLTSGDNGSPIFPIVLSPEQLLHIRAFAALPLWIVCIAPWSVVALYMMGSKALRAHEILRAAFEGRSGHIPPGPRSDTPDAS